MYTEQDFFEFMAEQLLRVIPSISKIDNPKDGTLKVYMNESDSRQGILVNLRSPWTNYVSSGGDSRTIQKFLMDTKNVLSMQSKLAEMKSQDVKDKIFPAIRNAKVLKDGGSSGNLLNEELPIPEFTKVFVMKNEEENLNVVLMKNQFKDMEEEEVKDTAYENLKNQGWLTETKTDEWKAGKLIQYLYQKQPFNAQFFINEWVEKKISTSFYISFPTNDSVYVYLPNKNPNAKLFLRERTEFMAQSKWIYENNGNPLSPIIHRYEDGEYTAINQTRR